MKHDEQVERIKEMFRKKLRAECIEGKREVATKQKKELEER